MRSNSKGRPQGAAPRVAKQRSATCESRGCAGRATCFAAPSTLGSRIDRQCASTPKALMHPTPQPLTDTLTKAHFSISILKTLSYPKGYAQNPTFQNCYIQKPKASVQAPKPSAALLAQSSSALVLAHKWRRPSAPHLRPSGWGRRRHTSVQAELLTFFF